MPLLTAKPPSAVMLREALQARTKCSVNLKTAARLLREVTVETPLPRVLNSDRHLAAGPAGNLLKAFGEPQDRRQLYSPGPPDRFLVLSLTHTSPRNTWAKERAEGAHSSGQGERAHACRQGCWRMPFPSAFFRQVTLNLARNKLI